MKKHDVPILIRGIEVVLKNRSSLSVQEVKALERALAILQDKDFGSSPEKGKGQVKELTECFLKAFGKVKLLELLHSLVEDVMN